MCSSHRVPRRRRLRTGLSVVEVLVALMLVSLGLLGITGSTALALRSTLDAAHRRAAADRVASRFALLAAGGCVNVNAGSAADAAHDLTERWMVVARANGFATITDSVQWMSARGPASFTLTSAFAC